MFKLTPRTNTVTRPPSHMYNEAAQQTIYNFLIIVHISYSNNHIQSEQHNLNTLAFFITKQPYKFLEILTWRTNFYTLITDLQSVGPKCRKQDNSSQRQLAPRQLAPRKCRPKTICPRFRRQLAPLRNIIMYSITLKVTTDISNHNFCKTKSHFVI